MIFVDKNNQGSSFSSSAHGWVGARTRIEFSATKIKKSFHLREGAAGGGGEGEESRRARALGWERLRSLAPSREAKRNGFQFLLKEKGSRAKIENSENRFALHRRLAAGGAAGRVNSVRSRFALRSVIATIGELIIASKNGAGWKCM